jgi:hypothetical protein
MTNPVGPNFIQRQLDPARTLGIIRQMMELLLKPLAARAGREDFYKGMSVPLRDAKPLETRTTRDDITVALANFLLVVLSCLPMVVSFWLLRRRALQSC